MTVVRELRGSVTCPICGQVFDSAALDDFKSHVFTCRSDSGVDPLLPLIVLRRSTPRRKQHRSLSAANEGPQLRQICSDLERVVLFSGRVAPKAATPRQPRPPPFTNTKVSRDLQYFATLPANERDLLTLQGDTFSMQDASLFYKMLAEQQLPCVHLDLSDTAAVSEDAVFLVVRGLLKNGFVEVVKSDNCSFAARIRTDALQRHFATNRERATKMKAQSEFVKKVAEFEAAEAAAQSGLKSLGADEAAKRQALRRSETDDRTVICDLFEAGASNVHKRLFHRELKRQHRSQRYAIESDESESRAAGERLHRKAMMQFVEHQETGQRHHHLHLTLQRERMDMKTQERSSFAEHKGRERARHADERQDRADCAASETAARADLESTWTDAFGLLLRQVERGSAFIAWKQKQRDDVAAFFEFETSIRRGIAKEEANLWVSSREKFSATVKGVLARSRVPARRPCTSGNSCPTALPTQL